MAAATEEVAEDVAGVILAGTLTPIVMAITVTTEDMDMVGGVILTTGGAILTGGVGEVILTGGATRTGGVILTILTRIPTTILIIMVVMGNRRCLLKGLPLRRNWDNSSHLIGTSARTQRVTIPTLKIVRVVG